MTTLTVNSLPAPALRTTAIERLILRFSRYLDAAVMARAVRRVRVEYRQADAVRTSAAQRRAIAAAQAHVGMLVR